MKRYLHQVQEHYLVFKQQNSEFVISSWKTFFCKYFADLAKTHKQRHQRAFKTTSSNKKEIVNVKAMKLQVASFKVQKRESIPVYCLFNRRSSDETFKMWQRNRWKNSFKTRVWVT